jgi:hypothetical protein
MKRIQTEVGSIAHINYCPYGNSGAKTKGRQVKEPLINIVLVTNKCSKEILRSFKTALELEKRKLITNLSEIGPTVEGLQTGPSSILK